MEENEIPTHPKLTFSVVSAIHVYFFQMNGTCSSFLYSFALSVARCRISEMNGFFQKFYHLSGTPRIIYLNFILAIYIKKNITMIDQVATFKKPTNSTGKGVYELKDEFHRSVCVNVCVKEILFRAFVLCKNAL